MAGVDAGAAGGVSAGAGAGVGVGAGAGFGSGLGASCAGLAVVAGAAGGFVAAFTFGAAGSFEQASSRVATTSVNSRVRVMAFSLDGCVAEGPEDTDLPPVWTMRRMAADPFLDDALGQLLKSKRLAEAALAQLSPEQWFERPDPLSNSVAIVVKHLAGNMRSRWTDFLTTDGEKPDRRRDAEFEHESGDTAVSLRAAWERGWALCFAAIEPLTTADLRRTVTIRGQPHSVLQAIARQVSHYSYHVGQIVYLARHLAGERWRSLSIPKGMSAQFEVGRDGRPYDLPGDATHRP